MMNRKYPQIVCSKLILTRLFPIPELPPVMIAFFDIGIDRFIHKSFIHFIKIALCRPINYMTIFVIARAMTWAIPGLFQAIPTDDTS